MCITLADAWSASYSSFFSKNANHKTEMGFWNNHINPFFGNSISLEEITTLNLLEFRAKVESKNLSPQTVHHCLSLVRRIFTKSQILGLYDQPTPKFIMPQLKNGRVRYLSNEECISLFNILESRSCLWLNISKFALYTGMRAAEIFHLKCENINFQMGGFHILDTKSFNRFVPFNATSQKIATEFYTKPNAYLFPSSSASGKPFSEVSKIFRKSVEKTELNSGITDRRQKVVFHTLRHTFASRLVQKGKTLEVVSKLLGHSSLQMTMRYAHLSKDLFVDAMQSLDNN
ncbi:MAG: site-specific integrase [Deltaproteobacteria bacterium]|jgi:site-specific recombinase XerD|nr:site-specific integrase [Deltaproteobacteria bacterium]